MPSEGMPCRVRECLVGPGPHCVENDRKGDDHPCWWRQTRYCQSAKLATAGSGIFASSNFVRVYCSTQSNIPMPLQATPLLLPLPSPAPGRPRNHTLTHLRPSHSENTPSPSRGDSRGASASDHSLRSCALTPSAASPSTRPSPSPSAVLPTPGPPCQPSGLRARFRTIPRPPKTLGFQCRG